MKDLIIASRNEGKISEIKEILQDSGINILSGRDFQEIKDIAETGDSYFENAFIKAKVFWEYTGITSLGDDSGLEVNILNGKPGIFSARYSGDGATDKSNREKLLNELKGVTYERRDAEFICVLVLYDGREPVVFEGRCKGKIATEERGNKGFGYDSIFIPDGFDLTFAEMETFQKQLISHRGKALDALVQHIKSKNL
ncbi:MAG: RdgB/HAM1 family non-canonical purine NTP pyrophosphatase [Ignavibacteria bacterium]|nr:RdgB/HAM1 family non-canonical purine NTP pyrophosphatase [Ignavibacteria bacterium]